MESPRKHNEVVRILWGVDNIFFLLSEIGYLVNNVLDHGRVIIYCHCTCMFVCDFFSIKCFWCADIISSSKIPSCTFRET